MNREYKNKFIEFMLGADVLRFGDFTTKSGRETPYFVNTGNYRTGLQLSGLGGFYAEMINKTRGGNFTAIFGPAYKGIPLAAAAAIALAEKFDTDKPYLFNRKEIKDHGEGGGIVGYQPKDGDDIIIVEDVITAGTALRESMAALNSCANITVKDMFISVDRCEYGINPKKTAVMEAAEQFGINIHALVTAVDIREYLRGKTGYDAVLQRMGAYMDKYCLFKL
ncbi:MAG: orotate phosphoribosyltransferase [Oscillospiraceae bacterium]|nr:orotate phosphoribosyltransferase [Oscillospiraceae bacterium]